MADGASGNIGGILFEAGKTISDAGKKQAQQIANSVAGQLGAQKPVFGGGPKQTTTGFTPKPLGTTNPLSDFGKMFEAGKSGGFGPKKPPTSSTPQFSQADLDVMAKQNEVKDQEEIEKKQAELREIQLQHKQLHDEMYYNAIRDAGKDAIAKERKQKQQTEQEEAEAKQQQQVDPLAELPANMSDSQMGKPLPVTRSQTQTEANRGTTG